MYLPPSYSETGPPCTVLWDLAAFTNAGPGHLNWRNQGENLPARLDRLIGSGLMEPAVVAIPDCYTSLGGNQYLNSLVGRRDGRGVFGKSSGGYGALYHAMHYPDVWGAAASHSGDVGFDLLFRSEFPTACSVLANYDGDPLAFLSAFWRRNRPAGHDFSTLMILAMAASYDPDPDEPARIRLPVDLRTCAIVPERWERWMAHDPLSLLEDGADALRSLRGLYIDVGIYDQYHIQFGSRRFVDALSEQGVEHRYEEFDGTHSAIDWRLDHSLPFLSAALKLPGDGSK